MKRLTWDELFTSIAILVATRASCHKRKVGACIVVDNHIVATGYNGAASGITSCLDLGYSYYEEKAFQESLKKERSFSELREEYKIFCQAVHAEENALAQAAKLGLGVKGGTLYVTNFSCPKCAKLIVQSGIKKVFVWKNYLENFLVSIDEKRASDYIFSSAGIQVNYLSDFSGERIGELAEQMATVGERTSYHFRGSGE